MIIVISGPSGVGKGTVVAELLKKDTALVRAITCTTRQPRKDEKDGIDYYFLSEEEFFDFVKKKKLAEFAFVHRNYYGTPIKSILQGKDKDVVLQIDTQGAKRIKSLFPEALLIFLLPPSIDALAKRLLKRGTETEEEREKRLERANKEIQERMFYDYIVLNDDLHRASEEIEKIIQYERALRRKKAL